jgi:hypothetical protein
VLYLSGLGEILSPRKLGLMDFQTHMIVELKDIRSSGLSNSCVCGLST